MTEQSPEALIGDSNWSIKFYRVADLHDPFPITAILFLRVIIYFCIYFKYNFLLSTFTQVDFFGATSTST